MLPSGTLSFDNAKPANQISYIFLGKKEQYPFVVNVESEYDYAHYIRSSDRLLSQIDSASSLANVGDLNGDGVDDLIIGNAATSCIFGYFGNSHESFSNLALSYTLCGVDGSSFGWAIEGFIDSIGQRNVMISSKDNNLVYVVNGKDLPILKDVNIMTMKQGFRIIGDNSDIFGFGTAISVGDFNADTFIDYFISGFLTFGQGLIYIVCGISPNRVGDIYISNYSRIITISTPPLSFAGSTLSLIGDVDSNGFRDLAIGSLPYANGRFSQRTFVLYGEKLESVKNETVELLQFLRGRDGILHGFIINGGGFVVSGCPDLNNDGVEDFIVVKYLDWPRVRMPSYVLLYPKNITASPTYFPTSQPSALPTNIPSCNPSQNMNTKMPSNQPSLNSRSPAPFEINITVIPTLAKSRKPTVFPSVKRTLQPSISATTLQSTCTPTVRKTFNPISSLQPSRDVVKVSRFPTVVRESYRPTVLPTFFTNFTDVWSVVYCTESGSYAAENGNNQFVISGTGTIRITPSSTGRNIFYLFPSNNLIIIDGYEGYKDTFRLVEYSQLSSFVDLSYSTNPLTIYLSTRQVITIPNLDSLNEFNISSIQFRSRRKNGSSSNEVRTIGILIVGGTMVGFFIFIAGKILTKDSILTDESSDNKSVSSSGTDDEVSPSVDDKNYGAVNNINCSRSESFGAASDSDDNDPNLSDVDLKVTYDNYIQETYESENDENTKSDDSFWLSLNK